LVASGLRRCNSCTRHVCSGGLETEALEDLLRGARSADRGTVGKDVPSEPIVDVEDRE